GGARQRGGDALRPRLHPRARARHAAHRRRGRRHRSPGDALHRRGQHPRRGALPAAQARGAGRGGRRRGAAARSGGPVRLKLRVTLVALVSFVLAGALQYGLSTWLGASSNLSRDAVTNLSFAAEALVFFIAGFVLSFVGRGYRPVENGLASLIYGVI